MHFSVRRQRRPTDRRVSLFQLFAIIVFGCISSEGWREEANGKEYCIINRDGNACNYAVGIGVIAFLAAMGFIAGEYLFEQMSSVKTRKHYVLADLGFSGKQNCIFNVILVRTFDDILKQL